MQDFDVFGLKDLFFFYTPLKVSRQDISSSISFDLMIVNLKAVTGEFLGLADLFEAQTLCIHESAEVIMVNKYKDFMLRAF